MARQRWVKIAGIAIAVVLLILVVTPFFVNADSFRPTLENQLSSALGRKVTMGKLSFSLWSASLTANNVAVADDPKFETAPFFQARSLHIGIHPWSLVFSHAVEVRKFVADSPEIHLISGPNGTWNYSTLASGSSGSGSASASSSSAQNMSVGELEIRNGSVIVSSQSGGKPFTYSDVNVTVKHLSYGQAMPFSVSANLPGQGSLKLTGTAGPLNRQDVSATPLQASLAVKHFDPVNAGVLPASEGVSMVADVNAQVTSDGKTLTSNGTLHADKLLLSPQGSPASQPVEMTYRVIDDLQTRSGQVQDLAAQTGSAAAHLNGTYQMAGTAVNLNLHLAAPNLPIDQLEPLLPAVGIRLPRGSSLKGGTLSASLDITGTASAPVIAGPVEIDNTALAGFDLGSKMQGLKALHALGNTTEIRTLRAQVRSTVPETQLSDIEADVPSIGTATGSGTVSAAGALDFHLTAKLSSTGAVGGAMNAAAGALGSLAGGLMHSASGNGIPVTVSGTTSDPVIRVNLAGMLTGQGGKKPGGLLKSLMGH